MRDAIQQRALLLLAVLTLAGTACAGNVSDPGPGKRVQVTLAKDTYLSGETVTFVLKNVSNVSVDYTGPLCRAVLQQQQQDGTWSTVNGPSKICTAQLGYVGAGQSVPLPYHLPQDLSNGLYRIAMPEPAPENAPAPAVVEPPELTVTTPPFTVNSGVLSQS